MKKTVQLILIVSCLILLSGCYQRIVYVPKEVPVLTPDTLLVDPCEPVGAGDTIRTLAKGYVKNTGCIREYRLLLEKQRKHKNQIEDLFKDGNTVR